MKKTIFNLLLIIIVQINLFAQKSPYSFLGVGTIEDSYSLEQKSMGGLGGAFESSYILNLSNPASYSNLEFVNFSFSGSYKSSKFSTSSSSDNAADVKLRNISIGIPMKNYGLGFGVIKYSNFDYDISSLDESSEVIYSRRFFGEGGLSKSYLALSYKINDLKIGLQTNYYFGSLNSFEDINLEDVLYSTRSEVSQKVQAFSFEGGVMYSTKISENNNSKLNLSASIELGKENETDFNKSIYTIQAFSEQVKDTVTSIQSKALIKLPQRLIVGASISNEKNIIYGLGFEMMSEQLNEGLVDKNNSLTSFSNGYRISGGLSFIPNRSLSANYFQKITYRISPYYGNTGINVSGIQINDFGMNIGLGLPISNGISSFNIGFQGGVKGKKTENSFTENYYNLYIGLSFSEKWFIKRNFN